MRILREGWLLGGLFSLACGAGTNAPVANGVSAALSAAPLVSMSAPPKTACTRAASMRNAASAMRTAGELARALRTLNRADALCPASTRSGQALLIDVAVELGLLTLAHTVSAALAAQPALSASERSSLQRVAALAPSDDFGAGQAPGTLAGLVRAALVQGNSAEARRALSRALVALERAERVPVVADVVAWSPRGAPVPPALTSGQSGWYARRGFDIRPTYVDKLNSPDLIEIVDAHTGQARLRVQRIQKIPADISSPIAGLMDIAPHSFVMVDDDGVTQSVDLDTGATKATPNVLKPELGLVWCGASYGDQRPAALSAAADLLAFAPLSGGVQLYRASTGALLETIAGQGRVRTMGDEGEVGLPCRVPAASGLRFTPDGSALLFTTPAHQLKIWHAGTRGARVLMPPVVPVEFGSADAGNSNVTPEATRREFARTVAVAVNAASKSAALLLAPPEGGNQGVLLVLRAEQRLLVSAKIGQIAAYLNPPGLLGFDASGRYVAALDGPSVTLLEVTTGRRSSLPAPPHAHVFAFAPSGDVVAVTGEHGGVTLWDTAHAKPRITIDAGAGSLRSLAWRGDGKQLAYGSDDGRVHVVDSLTGKPVLQELALGSAHSIAALAFDPSGHKLYALGGDSGQRSWDLEHGGALETAAPQDKIRPFDDARFSIMWRKSSEEPEVRAAIDYCPVPNPCGSATCAKIWDSFPTVTADCHIYGEASMWQAKIGATLRPEAYLEITPSWPPDVVYLRASSPDVVPDEYAGPRQARLLSGEQITVADPAFDGFSSVATLGNDDALECRVGRWVFPIAACRDLLLRQNLLQDTLSGDDAYRDD